MDTYVTRPEAVQALQVSAADFEREHPTEHHVADVVYLVKDKLVAVATPRGQMLARPGDWIVKTKEGLTCLRSDQFAARYVPANQNQLDAALTEIIYLREHISRLPNPLPGAQWDTAYINWWFRWIRNEAERKADAL